MKTKSFFKSRTIWLAGLQFLAGVLVVFTDVFADQLPEAIGYVIMTKSIVDALLRSITAKPIK